VRSIDPVCVIVEFQPSPSRTALAIVGQIHRRCQLDVVSTLAVTNSARDARATMRRRCWRRVSTLAVTNSARDDQRAAALHAVALVSTLAVANSARDSDI
jgi:hypothetical protein